MDIELHCFGKYKNQGLLDYEQFLIKQLRRFPLHFRHHRPKQSRGEHGNQLLAMRKAHADLPCLVLSERGANLNTQQFAQFLEEQHQQHRQIHVFLGAYFGIPHEIEGQFTRAVALSPMTLPHELARVVFTEQIYRCEKILTGAKYHY